MPRNGRYSAQVRLFGSRGGECSFKLMTEPKAGARRKSVPGEYRRRPGEGLAEGLEAACTLCLPEGGQRGRSGRARSGMLSDVASKYKWTITSLPRNEAA